MKTKSIHIYGFHAVRSALECAPERTQVLFVQQERSDKRAEQLMSLAKNGGVSIQRAQKPALDKLAESGVHQGFVAKVRPPALRSEAALLDAAEDVLQRTKSGNALACFLVLEGVTDPHNLGACLRTCAAAGVAGVIVGRHSSASLGATALKVSSGAGFSMPVYEVSNIVRTLKTLQTQGYWAVGTALAEDAQSLYDLDLSGPLLLVMGAEGQGLKRLTLETCDHRAIIPMTDSVGSLNVSVAVGVTVYEAHRQSQLRNV